MEAGRSTIFAVSTGAGRAGVAVVRISGPAAEAALLALSGGPVPLPRTAVVRTLRDPGTGEVLDRGLVLLFPEGASFTGEASVELQVHGSRAVVAGLMTALGRLPGCRVAERGEFTRRAFENGKLDLAQVEALDDLIAADTAAQRRQALRGLDGRLGRVVAGWRGELLTIRGLLAAEIDFADEGDVGDAPAAGIDSHLLRLIESIDMVRASSRSGRIVAEGFRVVILGRPNSGKSTLLNALAGTDAAITSEIAGTTRDIVEVRLDWDGCEIVLADTAGLRETSDPVERIGVARALERGQAADLVLLLDSVANWLDLPEGLEMVDSIRVRSKSDIKLAAQADPDVLEVSALTGAGLPLLRAAILEKLRAAGSLDSVLLTRERQTRALDSARAALHRALLLPQGDVELRDHEVQAAGAALDVMIGRLGVEEVLSAVFSRFCVGK